MSSGGSKDGDIMWRLQIPFFKSNTK
jgi:hypothetical protein